MGEMLIDRGDKWVEDELLDVATEVAEREVVRRERNEVRLGS
jgi:hypothetical protein